MRTELLLSITGLILLASQVLVEEAQSLKTQKGKIINVIGFDQIKEFKRKEIDADLELVIRGTLSTTFCAAGCKRVAPPWLTIPRPCGIEWSGGGR